MSHRIALTLSTPVDELVEAAGVGWPRALLRVPWKPRAYPLPWINKIAPAFDKRGWLELDGERVNEARADRLCFCCGESLLRLSIMGRHRASFLERGATRWIWMTDGPPGHPRCLALAAEHCPHLRKQHKGAADFVIAFLWDKPMLGFVDLSEEMVTGGVPRFLVRPEATPLTLGKLRALAASNPLGS